MSNVETMNCKGCGKDKPIPEMFVRGGKPIRTCRICRALQMGGGRNGPKPTDKRIAALADKVASKVGRPKAVKAPRAAAPGAPRLEISAGFGVKAEIDDGYLTLSQRDVKGDIVDTLVLTRSEARLVFETFGSWAT